MDKFKGFPTRRSAESGFINTENLYLFGKKLKEARMKLEDKSMMSIANKIEVDTTAVSAWENGKSLPDETKLYRIAVMYKIEGADFKDLKDAFEISSKAREVQRKSRK
ncbi:MAG: helix-turn-helix transcriptional regulator [Candidatus Pacebacteria bacterium]|nr:helix-turn-helix transcriptional regulator [Candidatus Paceibacterota bacterium]